MASFMYNPSQRVTEMLSQFLEFDPEQLEIGVWSGDLSLRDVHLRKEAVAPLLNSRRGRSGDGGGTADPRTTMASSSASASVASGGSRIGEGHGQGPDGDLQRDPLALTLVSGTVGHMRIRIPWKQLVWGQGAVHVEISDVTIVVTAQSREETEREKEEEEQKKKKEKGEERTADGDDDGERRKDNKNNKGNNVRLLPPASQAYRDAKQRRLREAEKRQLEGTPVAWWLETLHRKNSILKEAQRLEQQQLQQQQQAGTRASRYPNSKNKRGTPRKEGRLDRLLKHTTSDLFWRLFAGIQGSVKKARIVFVQDGIEVGCIIQSMDVVAGRDGVTVNRFDVNNNEAATGASESQHYHSASVDPTASTSHGSPHPPAQQYEGAYDDGEHVDKTLQQHGLGIFVRRETTTTTAPPNNLAKKPPRPSPMPRFSAVVGADDYILRPVSLDLSFSFFYPYPPERRKKKATAAGPKTTAASAATATATTGQSHDRRTTAGPPGGGQQSLVSGSEHTTASSKVRRGKRDRLAPPVSEGAVVATSIHAASEMLPQPQPFSTTATATTAATSRVSSLGDIDFAGSGGGGRDATAAARMRGRLQRSNSSDRVTFRGGGDMQDSTSSLRLSAVFQPQLSSSLPPQTSSSGSAAHQRRLMASRSEQFLPGLGQSSTTPDRVASTPPRPRPRSSDFVSNLAVSTSSPSIIGGVGGRPANSSVRGRIASGSGTVRGDSMSIVDSPTVLPDMTNTSLEPIPRLECRVGMDEIRVIFTTRHYELLSSVLSTIARMKNGRPDRTIRSIKETEPGAELRRMTTTRMAAGTAAFAGPPGAAAVVAGMAPSPSGSPYTAKPTLPTLHDGSWGGVVLPTPIDGSCGVSTTPKATTFSGRLLALVTSTSRTEKQAATSLPSDLAPSSPSPSESYDFDLPGIKSARQEAVVKWWKYAIGAIQWELRKREHVTSAFRKMYLSFDWSKQRYRRREYIDLYIQFKLDKNQARSNNNKRGSGVGITGGGTWLFEEDWHQKQKNGEKKLLEIEDELPLEQILLYRSLARGMRVRGKKEMPATVLELWGDDEKKKAHMATLLAPAASGAETNLAGNVDLLSNTNNGVRTDHVEVANNCNTISTKNPMDSPGQNDNLLGLIQRKFGLTTRLRQKGGILERFESAAPRFPDRTKENAGEDRDGSTGALSTEAANVRPDQFPAPPETSPIKRSSFVGFANYENNSQQNRTMSRHHHKTSTGIAAAAYSDLQAGYFYTSGGTKRDSQPGDVKTIKSSRFGQSRNTRHVARGYTISSTSDSGKVEVDNHLRVFFSFQVKLFELTVVEEDYYLDASTDVLRRTSASKIFSPNASKILMTGDADESSSADDLSELSVLTDDQRFFSEEGTIDVITEEDDDDEAGAKLSSTDFLRFGQPENPLLRLTVSSFQTTAKGVSGGAIHVGLSIGKIRSVGDKSSPILSIGHSEPSIPVAEVEIDVSSNQYSTRRSSVEAGCIDGSTVTGLPSKMDESSFLRKPSNTPGRAVSMIYTKDGPSRIVQCDFSKIVISANVTSAAKLLTFYGKSEVKQPERLLMKSSRDVARKIMVKKMSSGPPKLLINLSSVIRIHGIEVRVPFGFKDGTESEASEIESSHAGTEPRTFSGMGSGEQTHHAAVLGSDLVELYSGKAVDELVQAASMLDGKDYSVVSGSFSSSLRKLAATKSLEMLDLAALTGTSDAFASSHFVLTVGGIQCGFKLRSSDVASFTDYPIDVELLLTTNKSSLLNADNPKVQIVAEVSPVHMLLSQRRLELLEAAKSSVDVENFGARAHIKLNQKPDPPRIEILSPRILQSLDINCRRVRIEMVKDFPASETVLPPQYRELIMEECLSDFLSTVSCFDLSLPNEETLSSSMQVCIARLVGIGLTDDEAWGCTNAARVNFLNDIVLMRKAQSDVLVAISEKMQNSSRRRGDDDSSTNNDSDDSECCDLAGTSWDESGVESESKSTDESYELTDDDSNGSVDLVETTVNNAVEKTVAAFAPLLQESFGEYPNLDGTTYLVFDLPTGLRLSYVKLFYDDHLTFLMTSLVLTNKAGIELLTLVPHVHESDDSAREEQVESTGHGIAFSRFSMDKQYGFGKGGLPMSVLASDEGADSDVLARERTRFDDVEVGELEILFSCKIYEEVLEEMANLKARKHPEPEGGTAQNRSVSPHVESSNVVVASSLSVLFTTDTLAPFCRLTLEKLSYKNGKALESLQIEDSPSWAVVAKSLSLQNLTPEGQLYPKVLSLLSPNGSCDFPFQLRYFQSSDSWKVNNRLEIDFSGFRLFLIRQFIHEVLQYFVYDMYGVGKLKKKYSTDVRDAIGNGKPPLLYSVYVYDTSIICPRTSTSSDMVSFEVEDACISVSYIPESFAMPTETTPFQAKPDSEKNRRFQDIPRKDSYMSSSDYEDCESTLSNESVGPISSHSSDLKKRLTIALDHVRIFTAIAEDTPGQNHFLSPLFRYLHEIDGRADDGKPVYKKHEHLKNTPPADRALKFETDGHRWQEMSTNKLCLELLVDYAPHMRLLIANHDGLNPFFLDAKLSQLCLLLSVWDSNMQEMPTMFPFGSGQVSQSVTPPPIPDDFPEYGTEMFVAYLERINRIRSEICCIFKKLTLRCTFDAPGFFSVDPDCFQYFENPKCAEELKPGLLLTFNDAVVHIVNDHLNVRRIAIGASGMDLIDERRLPAFQHVLTTSQTESDVGNFEEQSLSWADLAFGLREDVRTLSTSLAQPVQCTVFMTPGWSMTNFGAQNANGVMHDLSWLWILLDYFKSYYSVAAFGNPGFQAQRWTHRMKNSLRRATHIEQRAFSPPPGVKVDVRLWLCQPVLCLPSEYSNHQAPALCITSTTGLWYRYKSIEGLSSQEIATTDLNLHFSSEYQSPEVCRRVKNSGVSSSRPLIESLSFGLRYDSNNVSNHKDISLLMPFSGEKAPSLSISGHELEVDPVALHAPKVVTPFKQSSRLLGPKVCEITLILEVLPLAMSTLSNFVAGPTDVNEDFAVHDRDQGPATYSISVDVGDFRFFAIDPDLGTQLPFAVVSVASVAITMSKFSLDPNIIGLEPGESNPVDLQVIVSCKLWADYFKLGMTRSWEPLLEAFEFLLFFEKSMERGQGFSVDSDSPFHLNLSGALLQALSKNLYSFTGLVKETFGDQTSSQNSFRRSVAMLSTSKKRVGALVEDCIKTIDGHELDVVHEIPKPLKVKDRVAFSLRNLTGQRIRIHQQSDNLSESTVGAPVIVTYLNEGESMGLTFAATISIVKNLGMVEVPYPGFSTSKTVDHNRTLQHAIDLQIPGCRWIQGVKVDTFGRKFATLTPRSTQVLSKISRDWRLKNAMNLLTEVGLDNGGRLVTVRSLFEVRNCTTHSIKLVFNPDPRYRPDIVSSLEGVDAHDNQDECHDGMSPPETSFAAEISVLKPGGIFQLPTLLIESALEITGSHLGSMWICPDTSVQNISFQDFTKSIGKQIENLEATFCSRPIQIAKVVNETALLFQAGLGEAISSEEAKSGVQVSCPTRSHDGDGQVPFCYAVEVGRSPIVNFSPENTISDATDSRLNNKAPPKGGMIKKEKRDKNAKEKDRMHGPVAYTFSIHPPMVIINLLPEGGRFELMHAVRKTVVWYADLQPGQQIHVHSIGLDAPLLLLVNLGFCRTPVGEGALVHHGGDTVVQAKDQGVGLKFIGKAVTKGTKQIGKTLTNLADSPDKRAQERLAKINTPQFYDWETRQGNVKVQTKLPEGSLGMDVETAATGGKVHSVETLMYSATDVACETTVVDSVGQRLTLHIENVRGGGGQRRVSLFCPFWIVNTTEHPLRYKQDKGKNFCCGTVISPDKDGTVPVDGSNRNYRTRHEMRSSRQLAKSRSVNGMPHFSAPINLHTIFPGTPGALAMSQCRCNLSPEKLASLIDHDLPLDKLADLAYMFNFYDEGLGTGNQMLSVQLYDGSGQSKYFSEWSRGFSLESVGFSQVVGIPCKEGRLLELSATVNVAPGFLAGYTKIVRFFPRYVIFNRLERPIRLWQDSSVIRPVSEDRASTTNHVDSSKESRKWRYAFEDRNTEGKINQYESLFGRHSIMNDGVDLLYESEEQTRQPIAEGTTAHRSAFYISTVNPSELSPFILPDTRSERQLRIDFGGAWNVTASFASDLPGEHILTASRATDLLLLSHVATRAAPKYKIILPPPDDVSTGDWDGELGVYFETDWGSEKDRRILVKGTRRGKYAFNHTDIHVGDELLRVDGAPVLKMTFEEVMKAIKDRLGEIRAFRARENSEPGLPRRGLRRLSIGGAPSAKKQPRDEVESIVRPVHLSLTFRTQEERLRRLRAKAGMRFSGNGIFTSQQSREAHDASTSKDSLQNGSPSFSTSYFADSNLSSMIGVNVEMKSVHNTMFVVLREEDEENPMFRVQNRSINHILFYRQRHCEGHAWNVLLPGESKSYCWEEPMKSKKLTVRVAMKWQDCFKMDCQSSVDEKCSDVESDSTYDGMIISAAEEKNATRRARIRQALAFQYIDNEERGGFGPSITVLLEEIGFRCLLPVPAKECGSVKKFLNCEVDTDGSTRLLIVADDTFPNNGKGTMNLNLDVLRKQITYEEERNSGLQSLRYLLAQPIKPESGRLEGSGNPGGQSERADAVEEEAKRLVEDFPEESTISSRYQVVVQAVEAVGLSPSDFVGSCNPYCEIFLKGRSKSRSHILQKRQNKKKTYFVEKSINPKWTDQVFVFDVPEEAVQVTRGHSIQVKVRNFRMVGQHSILGQASVHFASLRNQHELTGWYPLATKVGKTDITADQFSDLGRGSIKLRVQWIYSLPALVDYFLMISHRRLDSLRQTRHGMEGQLEHAVDSEERKREARKQLPGGRITKLAKLDVKSAMKEIVKRDRLVYGPRKVKDTAAKLTTSTSIFKDSVKASRDRYLYALYFQTAESKRNRLVYQSDKGIHDASRDASPHPHQSPGMTAQVIPSSTAVGSRKNKLESSLAHERLLANISPRRIDSAQNNRRSLDDFFSQQRSPGLPKATSQLRSAPGKTMTPSRAIRRGLLDTEAGRQMMLHHPVSLDVNAPVSDESNMAENEDPWQPSLLQGQAVYDGLLCRAPNVGISDLMSVSTDMDEEAKRAKQIVKLMSIGYVFHEAGENFHDNHLPKHFRRSMYATSMNGRQPYCPKVFLGTSSSIRHFKSWQAASALFCDPELDVVVTEESYLIRFKEGPTTVKEDLPLMCASKSVVSAKLTVSKAAPPATIERCQYRIETMYLSRTSFERTCRRILGCVLNPGGWLTIRPIAALNLPDSYTGMFVKLIYGSEVLVSETVDAKVSPRWSPPDFSNATRSTQSKKTKKDRHSQSQSTTSDLGSSGSDLHIHVEPQQTSGSIRLSVVAERMNAKVELGVLYIPLGAAIAACIDVAQEMDLSADEMLNNIPTYTRWFPLMEPRLAVPVEGDMGLSSRPGESEQLRDNMFQQYFAPCIQLSLMWWPEDHDHDELDKDSASVKERSSRRLKKSSRVPRKLEIENYFNADVNRISVALIDSQRAVELLNLSIVEIDVRYAVTRSKTRISLVVGWIQLDHQDNRSREPVVLAPTPTEHIQPTLQFLALKDNLRTKSNIVSYEYIGIALQEMDVTVEESWIFELWEFFISISARQDVSIGGAKWPKRAEMGVRSDSMFSGIDVERGASQTLFSIIDAVGEGRDASRKKKIYVEQLILGLVKVNLSYVKGKKQQFEVTGKGAKAMRNMEMSDIHNFALAAGGINLGNTSKNDQSEVFTRWSQLAYTENEIDDTGGVHNLPGIIAAVFPSVSDAPIRLQGKVIEHVFECPEEIFSSVKNYYVNETLKQIYKVIGSLDFVGNPTILFSSFVSGVRDLVAAPTAAFLKSPTNVKEVGIGVGKGTLSLFSHSASGVFGFSARLWATAGQAVATLSMDAEYRQWHRDRIVNEATNLNRTWKRRGVQSIQEIILRPVADVAVGITMGATGFIISPYRGARRGGAWGFVRGIGVGTAGVVAKPIVGVFDALTHASQTVHDLAKSVNVLERRFQPALKLRLPYVFGPMNVLTPFDVNAARSVNLLGVFAPKTKLKRRMKRRQEVYVHSEVLLMEPGVATFAIATSIRVLLVKLRRDNNNSLTPSFGWEVDLSGGVHVSSAVSDHGHNGVALTITKLAQSSQNGETAAVELTTKPHQRELERPKQDEMIQRSKHSAAVSVNSSALSDYEEKVGDIGDIGEDLIVARELSMEFKASEAGPLVDAKGEDEYCHGATVKGGKAVEWFTVLAEYQHRKQLIRLHNAISCIVGDYDAVIPDHARRQHPTGPEGKTKFGVFVFEKGVPDARAANLELVQELENLPWMPNALFERLKGYSAMRQKDFLSNTRRTWVYSKDLEESVSLGGPAWLIEARARAMFVSPLQPIIDDFDINEAAIEEAVAELDHETVTTKGAAKKLTEADDNEESSTIENSKRDNTKISSLETNESSSGDLERSTTNSLDQTSLTKGDGGSKTSARRMGSNAHPQAINESRRRQQKARMVDADGGNFSSAEELELPLESDNTMRGIMKDRQGDVFYSTAQLPSAHDDLIEKSTKQSISEQTLSLQENAYGGQGESDEDSVGEFAESIYCEADSEEEGEHDKNLQSDMDDTLRSVDDDDGAMITRRKQNILRSTGRPMPAVQDHDLSSATAHSRMDRMESVMEQLLILNATQVQRQFATGPMETQSHPSSSINEIADSLKHELAEIREKMDVRAKEDEALRNEISLLRDQLADRRKTPDKAKAILSKARKFPVPEIKMNSLMPRRMSGGKQQDSTRAHGANQLPGQTGR